MKRAAVIVATGSALPIAVETNEMLARRLNTSDEWIRQRTGIAQRHIATTESTADLAVMAGHRALELLNEPAGIDQVIVATTTPDRVCPAVAPEVAHRLGLGTAAAFDVAAVCSGFLYALRTARDAILAGTSQRTLVIAAEVFTRLLNPQDRSTVAIFGDGAGAVVVEAGLAGSPGEVHAIRLQSDGALASLITANGNPVNLDKRNADLDPFFQMQGQAVFLNAILRMESITRETLESIDWSPSLIDHFVGHQANVRILNAIAERLEINSGKVLRHLERVGNTGGASIPLALDDALRRGEILPGHRLAMAAFGGGATWGAAAISAPDITSFSNKTSKKASHHV